MSEMFDASVRVEEIIWIPGAVVQHDARPEAFDDFCESVLSDDRWRDLSLFKALPELTFFAENEEDPDLEWVAESLRTADRSGFLVHAATPVMAYDKSGRGASFSWGHYYTEWLYADTADGIAPLIAAWAEEKHEADRKKALARPT